VRRYRIGSRLRVHERFICVVTECGLRVVECSAEGWRIHSHYLAAGIRAAASAHGFSQRIPRTGESRGTRRASKEGLGRFLKSYGVERVRLRDGGSLAYFYRFPDLATCREQLSRSLAAPPDWDEADAWAPFCPLLAGSGVVSIASKQADKPRAS
jgi:hypothetical protein